MIFYLVNINSESYNIIKYKIPQSSKIESLKNSNKTDIRKDYYSLKIFILIFSF